MQIHLVKRQGKYNKEKKKVRKVENDALALICKWIVILVYKEVNLSIKRYI